MTQLRLTSSIVGSAASRTALVLVGSIAAYVAIAFVVYWIYFSLGDAVYERATRDGLGTVQILFYVALAVHLIATLVAHVGLSLQLKAPTIAAFVLSAVVITGFVFVTLASLSSFNLDHFENGFPMPERANR